MRRKDHDSEGITRRSLLKGLGAAPLLLNPSLLDGASLLSAPFSRTSSTQPFHEEPFVPHYPSQSPLQDVLRLVEPGSDAYLSERYAMEIGAVLEQWQAALESGQLQALAQSLDSSLQASSLQPASEVPLRAGSAIHGVRRTFSSAMPLGPDPFLQSVRAWLGSGARVEHADFQITAIDAMGAEHAMVRAELHYDITSAVGAYREQRVGTWHTVWNQGDPGAGAATWKLTRIEATAETLMQAHGPVFVDVTEQALGSNDSYKGQLLHGADTWRTVLDGASGIDVYGNNGVAAGDLDNDGWDDLYVSQPAGLPNRLYRNRGDGSFEDVTEKAGVGVLDNTACAIFADFRNIGLQDLLVVCSSGPLMFVNRGDGTFAIRQNTFRFAQPPQGSFTHAAVADYDQDGRLDIYFCVYSYYLGLDQYHYPVPYFDARNGPPNFLFHNEGDGTFADHTETAGMQADNDRYSFAAAWGEASAGKGPDLYVANDFGRNSFYRNQGHGKFVSAATQAHVEDVGAGMSACWADIANDGKANLYAANMWSAAGQRVSQQRVFHQETSEKIREVYQQHARGNTLYRNQGDGSFTNVTQAAGVAMGRWAWGSDFWDFDHDGYLDLYVTNGYISAPTKEDAAPGRRDLGSFFWRQVVANSPQDATPTLAYERGWNALNELIRSDRSWSGSERNVLYANNRDGSFSEVSGVAGLDLLEDGRSFALADIDHDGRLEVIVKNRNAPQLRILRNAMMELGDSIAFRLQGTRSNRDGIGAAVTLECGDLRQTRYLQAGSGFLSQHAKEVFFGLGFAREHSGPLRATVRWPSGVTQEFADLPRNHRIALEEGVPTFHATPFSTSAASYSHTRPQIPGETLPESVETWLLEPLPAPAFRLPDLAGQMHSLDTWRGSSLLLVFWSSGSPASRQQFGQLRRAAGAYQSRGVGILLVCLDQGEAAAQARSLASAEHYPFPVLFSTDDMAGVYNITYRYLFDRRRDLHPPIAFLIDPAGFILKVFQGVFDPAGVLADINGAPASAEARMRKALPFTGTLYQGSFARNDFTYGVAMFQHGYMEQAEASFRQVISAKPDNAEGFYNLGTLQLRKNDLGQAEQSLKKAVALRPSYPEAWNNLGMLAAQQGRAEDAVQDFKACLALRPAYATALMNLGNVYRRQGKLTEAQDCLARARALEPENPEANYGLGMVYAQQDHLESASEYLAQAIALRPNYPEALNNLGVLYVRQQDYPKAEDQFRTCIRLDPEFEQSYINLARVAMQQQDKAKAVQALKELLRVHPQSPAALQGLALLRNSPGAQ